MSDHISDGMTPENTERILRNRAEGFRYDPQLEAAIKADSQGASISPATRMALGSYKLAKKAAEAAGKDTSNPAERDAQVEKVSAAYDALKNPRPASYTL